MGTRPLTQRLYDKTKLDLSEFDNQLAAWAVKQRKSGLTFGGSAVDIFWQQSQTHLQSKIAEYFEWIEKESAVVNPSSLRRESIDQCVGAVVTYSRGVRKRTIEKNRLLAGLSQGVDQGHWLDMDDQSIQDRGNKLLFALGLDSSATISSKLNHVVSDHKWLPLLISILSIIIAIAAFFRK